MRRVMLIVLSLVSGLGAYGCGAHGSDSAPQITSLPAHPLTTTTTAPASQPVPQSAITAAEQAVAPVTCYNPHGRGLNYYEGTAFELMNGDAISASHVVSACGVGAPIELGQIGESVLSQDGTLSNPNTDVTKNDKTHDVAVLSGLPTLLSLQPETVPAQPGEQVALIGFPGSGTSVTAPRQLMVTAGTITAVDTPRTVSAPLREGNSQETLPDAIGATARSEQGESGGVAIDPQGKVIGVIEGGNPDGTVLTPVSDLPLPPSAAPSGATTLTMGNWTVVEPTTVAFSGDGGNVVSNLAWSSWTSSSAVGAGTSAIQSCVPNCATGSSTTVSATVTLANPQDGHFTEITETRNGTTTTWAYPEHWPWP